MIVLFAAGAGALVGLGLALIAYGLSAPRSSLAAIEASLDRRGMSLAELAARSADEEPAPPWRQRLGGFGGEILAAFPFVDHDQLDHDLRVSEISVEQHAFDRAVGALIGAGVGFTLGVAAMLVGVVGSPAVAVAGGVAGAVVGFEVVGRRLKQLAQDRRSMFRAALSGYIDLVVVRLGSGYEIGQATTDAATEGEGWAFEMIGDSLRVADLAGRDLWSTLDDLGRDIDVTELRALARRVSSAAARGSSVASTLVVQSDVLRSSLAAEIEKKAARDTEAMVVPIAVLVVSMMAFVAGGAALTLAQKAQQLSPAVSVTVDHP